MLAVVFCGALFSSLSSPGSVCLTESRDDFASMDCDAQRSSLSSFGIVILPAFSLLI